MKRLNLTIMTAALVCLTACPSTSIGQSRFSKGGGFKSFSGGTSGSGTSRGRLSGKSGQSGKSRNSPSVSQGGTFGGTSSPFGNRFKGSFGNRGNAGKSGSSNIKSIATRQSSSGNGISKWKTDSMSRFPTNRFPAGKLQNGLLRPGGSQVANGKPITRDIPRLDLSKVAGRFPGQEMGQAGGKRPSLGGKGLPVPSRQPTVSGKASTTKFHAKRGWQNLVRNIVHGNRHHWCHTRPAKCHWWVSYCAPIAHCNAREIIVCDWNRVHCASAVSVGAPVHEVQWYLGMKGILLPGKGIGIDAVEPNSPAAAVGLRPGMVLTVCNGIPMTEEAAMAEAIRISGGILEMTLLSEDGSQILEGTVRMIQVASVRF